MFSATAPAASLSGRPQAGGRADVLRRCRCPRRMGSPSALQRGGQTSQASGSVDWLDALPTRPPLEFGGEQYPVLDPASALRAQLRLAGAALELGSAQ